MSGDRWITTVHPRFAVEQDFGNSGRFIQFTPPAPPPEPPSQEEMKALGLAILEDAGALVTPPPAPAPAPDVDVAKKKAAEIEAFKEKQFDAFMARTLRAAEEKKLLARTETLEARAANAEKRAQDAERRNRQIQKTQKQQKKRR